jgi:hypothetical protein
MRCCPLGLLCGRALDCSPDITRPPSPSIRFTVHDISRGLENQLVPELELWKAGREVFKLLPCCCRRWFTLPLDQDLFNTAS